MFPYQALFGQPPLNYIHYNPKDSANDVVDSLLSDREGSIQLLNDHLAKAQNRMKVQADKHRSERQFVIGVLGIGFT